VRTILLAALLLLPGMQSLSQAVLMESVVLPPRFFVGDHVELRLKYWVPAAVAVAGTERPPEHDWIEVQRIEVQDRRTAGDSGEVLVRVFFIPFAPGQSALPSIRLGELETGEVPITTRSALQSEKDPVLRELRGQLNLPLAWLKLLLLAAVAVGAPVAAYLLIRWGLSGMTRVRQARKRRLPYVRLQKSLRRLAAQMAAMEAKPFFVLLSLAFRRYLSERLEAPLMSVTTGDIVRELDKAGLAEDVASRVHELLGSADLIKFSGVRGTRKEMDRSMKAAVRIVEQVEETTHVAL
jgi:hypothetical protein